MKIYVFDQWLSRVRISNILHGSTCPSYGVRV